MNDGINIEATEHRLQLRSVGDISFDKSGCLSADALQALSNKYNIEVTKLGTTGGSSLKVNETEISIDELNNAFTETLPKLFA